MPGAAWGSLYASLLQIVGFCPPVSKGPTLEACSPCSQLIGNETAFDYADGATKCRCMVEVKNCAYRNCPSEFAAYIPMACMQLPGMIAQAQADFTCDVGCMSIYTNACVRMWTSH